MTATLKLDTSHYLAKYVLENMDGTARAQLVAKWLEIEFAKLTKNEDLREELMRASEHFLDSEMLDGRTISIEYDDGEEKYVPQPDELPR